MSPEQSKTLMTNYMTRASHLGSLSIDRRLRSTRIKNRVTAICKISIFGMLCLLIGYITIFAR